MFFKFIFRRYRDFLTYGFELYDCVMHQALLFCCRYVLSIENARDLEDYLKTLLNFNNAHHRQFYEELLQKRQAGN